MQLPTATLNPCDDGASISTREWQPVFPAWAQVSVNQACLQTAERGWNGRADPSGRVGLGKITFIKTHYCPSTSRDQSNYKSVAVDLCFLLWMKLVNKYYGREKDRMRTRVSVIYVSAPSVFPDLSWILFCGAAPQLWVSLLSLMLCQLLIREAAYFSPSHYNLSGFALYPLNVSRHLQVPYIPRQNNSFATIWG